MTKRVWIAGGMIVTGETEVLTDLGLKPAPWAEMWATNRMTYGTAMLVG
jgi:hypothetical protein